MPHTPNAWQESTAGRVYDAKQRGRDAACFPSDPMTACVTCVWLQIEKQQLSGYFLTAGGPVRDPPGLDCQDVLYMNPGSRSPEGQLQNTARQERLQLCPQPCLL